MERPEYIQLFSEIVNDPSLSYVDAIVYGYIHWFTRLRNERCTASNETLAVLAGVKTGTIENSLTALEESKFIERRFVDDNPHKGRLEIIPLLVASKVPSTSGRRSHQPVGGSHQPVDRVKALRESIKEPDVIEDDESGPFDESQEPTYIPLNDDGDEPTYRGLGRAPSKRGAVPRNKEAMDIQTEFSLLSKKNLGVSPVRDMKGYRRALAAAQLLSREQISNLFQDWFDAKGKEEDKVSLSAALSTNSIDRFKVREGIV